VIIATREQPVVSVVSAKQEGQPVSTVLQTPATQCIADLAKLQTDLSTASSVISGINLGPFQLGGSCDYDCFIGICIHTCNWSWKLDFTNVREPLQDAVAQLTQAAGQFGTAFEPTRAWLKTTLPQFSTDFATQAKVILDTNASIPTGGNPTPAQVQAVQSAFQAIVDGLGTGQQQMNGATEAMAQFNLLISAKETMLGELGANIQASIDDWIQKTQNDFVSGLPCGGGDADNQVNNAVNTFNSSFAYMQGYFTQVAQDGQAVAIATDQFVGTLTNIQAQYADVLQQVKAAQGYPASVIQNLHLDIAQNEWAQLAQFAAEQIQ
jgi:hypothetical protein